ncbi:unnamed protein product [marine sediment metagenome]|uniref:Uncharacterized protein n=1 Tax=marine sediment metagenome TaxID=412755 RepID=X0WQK6_9ZZZZ
MVKGNKIKEISFLNGMMQTVSALGNLEQIQNIYRSDKFNTRDKNWVVDTCVAFDTGTWETGISQDKEENWTIAEQYKDRDEAKIGHEKWVKLLKEKPNVELEDINVWGV